MQANKILRIIRRAHYFTEDEFLKAELWCTDDSLLAQRVWSCRSMSNLWLDLTSSSTWILNNEWFKPQCELLICYTYWLVGKHLDENLITISLTYICVANPINKICGNLHIKILWTTWEIDGDILQHYINIRHYMKCFSNK